MSKFGESTNLFVLLRMCWNEQVSFLTYIIVIIIIYYIVQQNPSDTIRWQCYFALAFITIQLLEGFLWISIKGRNNQLNALITALVLIALWSQPLINTYYGYKLGDISESNKTILLIAYVIFAVILVYMIFRAVQNWRGFNTETTASCHLKWTRSDSKYSFMSDIPYLPLLYIGGLLLPLLMIQDKKQSWLLFGIGLVTLIVALMFYRKDGSFSSMWCFLAFFYVLGILYLSFNEQQEYPSEEVVVQI